MVLTKYSYECLEFSKIPCKISELREFIQKSLNEIEEMHVDYKIVSTLKENASLYGKHGYYLCIIIKWK